MTSGTIAWQLGELAVALPGAGHHLGIVLGAGLVLLIAAAYIGWHLDPAHVVCAALVASLFSGNWDQLGFPNSLPPDRILLLSGLALVLFRAPAAADRPVLKIRAVHLLLLAAGTYAFASAMFAGTLTDSSALFRLTDRLGLLPFAVFALAPLTFRTESQRRALMATLVGIGAYLGVCALLETIGPKALVLPHYINNPEAGLHYGRARGPFLEAQTMGLALFGCGVASCMAFARWRTAQARLFALLVAILCCAGMLFTLERAVWVGGALAAVVTLIVVRDLRRYAVVIIAGGCALVAGLALFAPGMSSKIHERTSSLGAQRSTWDRKNLDAAAIRIAEAHPVFGVGWDRFTERAEPYLRTAPDYPVSGGVDAGLQVVHNAFLSNAAELGLVGTFLWCSALAAALGGPLYQRHRPELRPWRAGLLAIAIMWLTVSNLIPLSKPFPTLLLFLWAGLAYDPRATAAPARRPRNVVYAPTAATAGGAP